MIKFLIACNCIHVYIGGNYVAAQAIVLDRNLAEVTSSSHLQRHLVDMIDSEVDEDAQRCLRELKTVKLVDSVSPDSCIRLEYSQPTDDDIRSALLPHDACLQCA